MTKHIKNNQNIGGKEMPKVGKKKFSYTKKGKAAAKKASRNNRRY